jgi:hypothetical protein
MRESDVNEFKEKIHNGSIDTAFPEERHRCGCGIFPGKRSWGIRNDSLTFSEIKGGL